MKINRTSACKSMTKQNKAGINKVQLTLRENLFSRPRSHSTCELLSTSIQVHEESLELKSLQVENLQMKASNKDWKTVHSKKRNRTSPGSSTRKYKHNKADDYWLGSHNYNK